MQNKNQSKKVWLICIMMITAYFATCTFYADAQIALQNTNYISHAPIQINVPLKINSSSDFTPTNGVSSGNGSRDNPWIIENLSIITSAYVNTDGGAGYYCIFIQCTSDYLIIRNCYISNHSTLSGIYLYNVSNCVIENNMIVNNYYSGVSILDSNNIILINNTIKDHMDGMSIGVSNGIVILNNSFISNDVDIGSLYNTNIVFTDNKFETGISIDGAAPYIPGIPPPPPPPSYQNYIWATVLTTVIIGLILGAIYRRKRRKKDAV
jgi:parallel beta-helix repeat protein